MPDLFGRHDFAGYGLSYRLMTGLRIAFAMVALSVAVAAADQPARAVVSLNPAWSVVLPASQAINLVTQCSRDTPRATASASAPTRAEIQELEARLGAVLAERLDAEQRAAPNSGTSAASDYFRQYVAITIKGRRAIYVNGFHRSIYGFARDWQREAVRVCDGGRGFFGVEYDPKTRTFSNFLFNGPG